MSKTHIHSCKKHLREGLFALLIAIATAGVQGDTHGSLGAHFLQKQPSVTVRARHVVRTRVLRRTILASAAKQWKPEAALKDATVKARSETSASSVALERPSRPTRVTIGTTSSSSSAASASSNEGITRPAAPEPTREAFPAFERTAFPVARTPDWGSMRSPEEWNRRYDELPRDAFVPIPSYDLATLRFPLATLKERINEESSIARITAKLFYSTRFFGAYDLDSDEFTFTHPGIDLKLAEGTPIGAVAGGKVRSVATDPKGLGLHVIIEHRLNDETFYSVYGHFENVSIREGDAVTPGQTIGRVGMTGFTTAPHLHLQIDRGTPDEPSHAVYWPASMPSRNEAETRTVHPIEFIARYRNGI